jgi:hypothetical protein
LFRSPIARASALFLMRRVKMRMQLGYYYDAH